MTMLTGPIPATAEGAEEDRPDADEIGVFEVNEAFAPVPLAWQAETGADLARLNPLGGAIAVGHPLGASGAILMTRMIAPHARQRAALRPADDVRGRRHGQRHRHRTGVGTRRQMRFEPAAPVHRGARGVPPADPRVHREGSRPRIPRLGEARARVAGVLPQAGRHRRDGDGDPARVRRRGDNDYRYNVILQEEASRQCVTLGTTRSQLDVWLPYFLAYATAGAEGALVPGPGGRGAADRRRDDRAGHRVRPGGHRRPGRFATATTTSSTARRRSSPAGTSPTW